MPLNKSISNLKNEWPWWAFVYSFKVYLTTLNSSVLLTSQGKTGVQTLKMCKGSYIFFISKSRLIFRFLHQCLKHSGHLWTKHLTNRCLLFVCFSSDETIWNGHLILEYSKGLFLCHVEKLRTSALFQNLQHLWNTCELVKSLLYFIIYDVYTLFAEIYPIHCCHGLKSI